MRRFTLRLNPLMILALSVLFCVYGAGSNAQNNSPPSEDWCCEGWVGDVDLSGGVDITDLSVMIDNMFLTLTPLECWGEADLDLSYGLSIVDLALLIEYFSFSEYYLPDCPPPPPTGGMLPLAGCKTEEAAAASTGESCIVWEYDGQSRLTLQHVNASLNCCPEGQAEITIVDGVITIDETVIDGLCDCICLFDVDMQVVNLLPGEYTIVVHEIPWGVPGETFEFTVDLIASPTGMVCREQEQ